MQDFAISGSLYGHATFSNRLVILKPASADRDVTINLSLATFVRPDGIAHLIATIYTLLDQGYRLRVLRPENPDVDLYLQRTNFWGLLRSTGIEVPPEWDGFNQGMAPRLIECQPIGTDDNIDSNFRKNEVLADRLQSACADLGLDRPLQRLFIELGSNATEHSLSKHGAVLIAQAYPQLDEIELSIVDVGQGIRAALHTAHGFKTDREALRAALEDGVSGRVDAAGKPKDGGLGLGAVRYEAAKLMIRSGEAVLYSATQWSGSGLQAVRDGNLLVMRETACPPLNGTIVTAVIKKP